jgi:hypothetical protein
VVDRRHARAGDAKAHQVFAPDDLAVEDLLDLVNDLFADAGQIDLRSAMRSST